MKNTWLWRYKGLLVVVLIIIALLIVWWRYDALYPCTDNAYTQANVVVIAAQSSGVVESVSVKDHQSVKEGDLLFTVDSTPYQVALYVAKDALKIAEHHPKTTSKEKLNLAKAAVFQAQMAVNATKVYAPVSGTVENLTLQPGNMVAIGVPLFAMVDNSQWWIEANFKETQLARIKPKQAVKFTLDMYDNHVFKGTVESIAAGSGAIFSLFPPENATGNWVKVTQRFPVRILIKNDGPRYPLRAGASAEVTIDTYHSVKTP